MSIEVMRTVWRQFPGSGGQLLCMLALANWSDDNGGSLSPSISYLAAHMRVSESQARRTLHSLFPKDDAARAAGDWFVDVVGNEAGGAPGSFRHYRLNIERLESLGVLVPERSKTGRTDTRGRMGARGRTDARRGVAPMRPNTQEIRKIKEKERAGDLFDGEGQAERKGEGCRLPEDFQPDLAVAVAEGMTEPEAQREAERFRDFWLGKPGKDGRKADWPATWRNWVRNAIDRRPSRNRSASGQQASGKPKAKTIGQAAAERRAARRANDVLAITH